MTDENMIEELLNDGVKELKLTKKQRAILQSAIEVFSEKGYAATSTSEIAKRAGVAEGTIFRHYSTKKELLLSIVTPLFAKIIGPFLAKSFKNDVFEKEYNGYDDFLRKLIINRLKFAQKNLPLLKIFLQEIAFHPEIRTEFEGLFKEYIYKDFIFIVNYFKNKGDLRDWEEEKIVQYTIMTIVGSLITRLIVLPDYHWDDNEIVDNTIDFIMNGLSNKKRY